MIRAVMKIDDLFESVRTWVAEGSRDRWYELLRGILANRRALKLRNTVDELFLGRHEVTELFGNEYDMSEFYTLLGRMPDVRAYLVKKGYMSTAATPAQSQSRSSSRSSSSSATHGSAYASDSDYVPSASAPSSEETSVTYASSEISSSISCDADDDATTTISTSSGTASSTSTLFYHESVRMQAAIAAQRNAFLIVVLCMVNLLMASVLVRHMYGKEVHAITRAAEAWVVERAAVVLLFLAPYITAADAWVRQAFAHMRA